MAAITNIFEYLGENPTREGLKESPARIVKSWERLFGGYLQDPKDVLTTFKEDNVVPFNQIILLKDIEFYSTCEHHFQPFIGKAHVAYIPENKVIGISKLARILEIYARRLQIQERIGNQVTETIMTVLGAKAAACIIEAKHLCMASRGVEKQNSIMVTSSLKGTFLENPKSRQELMSLIK
ncbi:MAG: GTP cyclohydrolase I FolE [Bdellovibrionales bacterium RIFOXYD12_FULL_39_22]|nr:MAG: GTP cyclohydrolase I FolE [Bdellovibrionales bacterium RIFOXYB1_FULL_39_21]OFZ42911.1 MAG: GTP cyclohydrolase I FolE [Bdellovibrionales bacterium RIFOXYC12_FULL_39_17]OFZ47518.1 MAG: GTP cyclohydrolase I FolE [Bdellovibrionales bacterium RIFOXYC1_FULL_39_130]OFZ68868.1 MAG: GTP cyclohydrolase I FolE [Bdellovibrionales bacterium RIFOXYC2_FULL_39_8]OFZ75606.1 MAG: GTP cyclohydrolase I FolE [Bdellovibrionales bacterium RIFOXYD1_FULL_39_84]OFZ93929.1 MAG: GTP cyclohydrolase I FolE [Bdellov